MPALRGSRYGNRLLSFLFTFVVGLAPAFGQSIRNLTGHKEAVSAVAFRPDGKVLASASFDKTLKLWDLATLKEIKTLEGHTDLALCVAFNATGDRLISGSQDKFVRLWSLPIDKDAKPPLATPAQNPALATSADSKWIFAGGADGVLRKFELATGKLEREFKGSAGPIVAVQFLNNGQLFSASLDRTVRVWDANSGQQIGLLEVGIQPPSHLAVLPNAQGLIVATADGAIKRFRLPIPQLKASVGSGDGCIGLKANPNGAHVMALCSDKTVRIHNTADGAPVRTLTLTANPTDASVSLGDHNLVATVSADRELTMWSQSDGRKLGSRTTIAEPRAIVNANDNRTLFVGEADGAIRAYPFPFVPDWQTKDFANHEAAITTVVGTLDGNLLGVAGDRVIRLWTAAGQSPRTVGVSQPIQSFSLSANGQWLAAVLNNQELKVWTADGQEKKTLAKQVGPVALNADGSGLAVIDAVTNKINLFATSFQGMPKPGPAHAGAIRVLEYARQAPRLLSAGAADRTIKLWDTAGEKELAAWQAPANIALATIANDASLVAVVAEDRWVYLWNPANNQAVKLEPQLPAAATSLSLSADKQRLAIVAGDNLLRLYENGKLRDTIPVASAGRVWLSSDGAKLYHSVDRTLKLATPNPPRIVGKHNGTVHALAITPDGQRIISAGGDNLAAVWQIHANDIKPVVTVAHKGPVLAVAVNRQGPALALTGSADKTAVLWQWVDGKILKTISAPASVRDVALASDGQRFAFAPEDGIVRIHKADGLELQTLTSPGLRGVAFRGDNQAIVTVANDKRVLAQELSVIWSEQLPAIGAMTVAANSARLLVATQDNQLTVRNPDNNQVIRSQPAPAPARFALANDSTKLALVTADKQLRIFDVNNGALQQEFPKTADVVQSVNFSADGKWVATTSEQGAVTLYTTPINPQQLGVEAGRFERPGPTSALQFAPDNKAIIFAAGDKSVRVLDVPSPPSVPLPGHNGLIHAVGFSADGKTAFSAGSDNNVLVWELATPKLLKTLSGHKQPVYSLAVHPTNGSIATCSADKTILLWDINGGKSTATLSGAIDTLYRGVFLPGGAQILGAGVDKSLRIWDVASGKVARSIPGQPDEVYGMALSPNGQRLATAGYAGNLIIWDWNAGKAVFQSKLPFGAYDVAFHPSGASVAVANNDGQIYLVELPANAR